jgi:hypothetical protein
VRAGAGSRERWRRRSSRKSRRGTAALLLAAVSVAGCGWRKPVDWGPLPGNAMPLSAVMQRVWERPEARQAILDKVGGLKSDGLPLTPSLLDRLRTLLLGEDWRGLDQFPNFTTQGLTRSVGVVTRLGAGAKTDAATNARVLRDYLDIGSYEFGKDAVVDLGKPAESVWDGSGLQNEWGYGVVAGDLPDPKLAPLHGESERLAAVLNRMAMNGYAEDAAGSGAKVGTLTAEMEGQRADSVEGLVGLLTAAGHTVVVRDRRYFANFGHLHYRDGSSERDVAMPFWIDTELWVPGTMRSLSVPVSHTELEIAVAGPQVNAVLAFYFGVDGKAEFRTTDLKNQAWVMGRTAHTYSGDLAVVAMRLMGAEVRAWEQAHVENPALAFGGYYTLGVCQDSVAVVEEKLTGEVTLYPLTAEAKYFSGGWEVASLLDKLPSDRDGRAAGVDRILGTLPVESAGEIPFAAMRADVERVEAGERAGVVVWTQGARVAAVVFIVIGGGAVWMLARRRRKRESGA